LWEKEVREYQKEISLPSTSSLMEWEHPARSFVDPIEAIARIVELRIEGDKVIGRAKLLNNEKANKLKNLIDEGIKIGVSSRGVGEVGRGGIVEEFKLITYDCVPNPSDYAAYTTGVVEGFQDGIYLNEEFDVQDGKIVKVTKTNESVESAKPAEPVQISSNENKESLAEQKTNISKDKVYDNFVSLIKSLL
jgi:hypothetical protein